MTKIKVDYNQSCDKCSRLLEFKDNHFDENGQYTHSTFYCTPCKTYYPLLVGEFVAESLGDDTVIIPDIVVN